MAADGAKLQRLSKDELLKYIESLSEQLNRYEIRFRDVVRAYKSVLKEKEALEASLKALSLTQSPQKHLAPPRRPRSRGRESSQLKEGSLERSGESDSGLRSESDTDAAGAPSDGDRHSAEVKPILLPPSEKADDSTQQQVDTVHQSLQKGPHSAVEGGERVEAKGSGSEEEENEEVCTLREQITTLTKSMAALTEQKAEMEARFQADKKKAISDQEASHQHFTEVVAERDREISVLKDRIDEMVESLQREQYDRQRDDEGHGEVIQELQRMLSQERREKEELRTELKESHKELATVEQRIAEQKAKSYELQIVSLTEELQEVRQSLLIAEERSSKPPPLLIQLQEDLEQMKQHHAEAIEMEQRRANEAEERLRLQAQHEERRVATLENRLSELSDTVGNYDRQREGDQMAILKLKERVAQLDLENTALTRAHVERQENKQIEEELATYKDEVSKYKALLRIAAQKLSDRESALSELEDLSLSDYSAFLSSQPSKKEYQEELSQLREEFERYKTRAQNVLKSKGNKESESQASQELQELRLINASLEKELAQVQGGYEEELERILKQNRELREEFRLQHELNQKESSEREAVHKQAILELQQRVQSTRERTLAVLKEKEAELEQMRQDLLVFEKQKQGRLSSLQSLPILHRLPSVKSVGDAEDGDEKRQGGAVAGEEGGVESSPQTGTAIQELLRQSSPLAESQLLHHAEEQARRDVELTNAKRAKLELEESLREYQAREAMLIDQVQFIKFEMRKLDRSRSRETANMEYIKNIVLHYMCTNSTGRQQMIPALATALHFSPEEVRKAKEKYERKWTQWS